jgi:hypothetical protein
MSWHYSQALVAAFSAESSVGSEPSAPSNTTPTHGTFWSPDKTTDASIRSRSGMMYAPSTDAHGAAVLMWCLEASPAKTSLPQEKAPESKANAPDSGAKWRGSLARWDRDTCSWRTPQTSLLADLDVFSETWPRWGMMRDGECSALSMPAHLTSETGSGLWPTPNCPNGGRSEAHVTDWRGKTAYHNGKKVQVGLESAVKLWRTPTVACANRGGMDGNTRLARGQTMNLADQLKAPNLCPSPPREGLDNGGSLNPKWVEWLMGWPLGWTACDAPATAKFRAWCRSHGNS